MHTYKIIAAPGVIFYTRAANIESVAHAIAQGKPIRTGDRTSTDHAVETIIGQFVSINREGRL